MTWHFKNLLLFMIFSCINYMVNVVFGWLPFSSDSCSTVYVRGGCCYMNLNLEICISFHHRVVYSISLTVLLLITILYTHFLIFITGTTNSSSCTISQLFKYPSAKKPSHIKSHYNILTNLTVTTISKFAAT